MRSESPRYHQMAGTPEEVEKVRETRHTPVKEGSQLAKNSPLCSPELVAGPGGGVEFST